MSFTLLPATAGEFIDREKEISEILKTLREKKSTLGFALYGKRRVGKTSIFKEVERRMGKSNNIITVYFSLLDMIDKNVTNFCKELAAVVLESYRSRLGLKHKAKDLIKLPLNILGNLLKDIKLSLEVKNIISLSLGFDSRSAPDLDRAVEEVFELPEKLAKETNTKCVLLIDEFPEIINLKKNGAKVGLDIVGKIRTIMEDKKYLSLNISGSIKKTMQQVAISPSSAFYRQFIVKLIEPLNRESIEILLKKNLPKYRITTQAANKIYEATKGFPFYVQFIGRIIKHSEIKKIDENIIEKAIDEFLTQEGNIIFKEEFSSLSDTERNILLIMAQKKHANPSQIAHEISADPNLIAKTLSYLIEKGIVEKQEKGIYLIEDPVFDLWLQRFL